MTINKIKSLALIGTGILMFGLSSISSSAMAQATGSRIGIGSQPIMAIQVNPLNEMKAIAKLLNNQKPEIAIKRLHKYLQMVTDLNLNLGHKYQGLNALCTAYTAVGEQEKAIDACNKAIAIFPTRWQAFNTRGSIHYVAGNMTSAEADYRKALQFASSKSKYSKIVENNLALIKK